MRRSRKVWDMVHKLSPFLQSACGAAHGTVYTNDTFNIYDGIAASYNGELVNLYVASGMRLLALDVPPADATIICAHAAELEAGGDEIPKHADTAGDAAQRAGLTTLKALFSIHNLTVTTAHTYNIYAGDRHVADLAVAADYALFFDEVMLGVPGFRLELADGKEVSLKHGVKPGLPASLRLFFQFKVVMLRPRATSGSAATGAGSAAAAAAAAP